MFKRLNITHYEKIASTIYYNSNAIVCQSSGGNYKFKFFNGTTGRIGVGASPTGEGNMWKPLNLSGQGSLAGRMEQTDYFDLLPALHFTPKLIGKDSAGNRSK